MTFLQCPLTKQLMIDPVFVSSGHTYSRDGIMKHIEKNGYIDPKTG